MQKSLRLVSTAAVLGLMLAGGNAMLVEHQRRATEVACAGTNCEIAWVNADAEGRYVDRGRVNCPAGTSTQTECQRTYTDSKGSSSNWGPAANRAVVPSVSPGLGLVFGGVYTNADPVADKHARVWTGASASGVGSGSASANAGLNSSGAPVTCVTAYAYDDTPGHAIAAQINAVNGHSNDPDFDTDATVCGQFAR